VIGLACVLAGVGVACSSKNSAPKEQSAASTSTDAAQAQAPPPAPPALIGQHLIAFGLELPPDLKTAAAAPGVYRFEGEYPASYLSTLVAGQVRQRPVAEAGGANLFRKTRARGRGAAETPLISVRIGSLATTRSFVDIWLEDQGARMASPGAHPSRRWVSGSANGVNKATASASEMAGRKARQEAVLIAAEKAAAGKPLTPQERELVR
jgi:hypothetical protein